MALSWWHRCMSSFYMRIGIFLMYPANRIDAACIFQHLVRGPLKTTSHWSTLKECFVLTSETGKCLSLEWRTASWKIQSKKTNDMNDKYQHLSVASSFCIFSVFFLFFCSWYSRDPLWAKTCSFAKPKQCPLLVSRSVASQIFWVAGLAAFLSFRFTADAHLNRRFLNVDGQYKIGLMISWCFPPSTCFMGTFKFKDSPLHCHTRRVWSFSCHAISALHKLGPHKLTFSILFFKCLNNRFQSQVSTSYRVLPSQPQATKRADPISKRIYVGLFAKLFETLASKGASRTERVEPSKNCHSSKNDQGLPSNITIPVAS